MIDELKVIAKDYIKLIAGALAIRAKYSPSDERLRYDPLAESMGRLALCLRKSDSTTDEYLNAIQEASSWWWEWYDRLTKYEQQSIDQHREALISGEWVTALGEAMLGDTSYLISILTTGE
jgi:hypothetical protein